MKNLDVTKGDPFTNEVKVNLNVLSALVLNGVARHVDDADVVTVNHCSTAQGGMKFKEELT